MPGPMADCAISTGAMLDFWRFSNEVSSSFLSSRRKFLRVHVEAVFSRLRQTRTMEEARAFVSMAFVRTLLSVRTGHVPVMVNPALIMACNIVSQPVDAVPSVSLSFCLKA